jgi:hypothetical protein
MQARFGVHGHRFAGSGVATGPGIIVSKGECSETTQLDPSPFAEMAHDSAEENLNNFLDIRTFQARILLNKPCYQLRLYHLPVPVSRAPATAVFWLTSLPARALMTN